MHWKTLDLEALREAAGTPGASTSVNVGAVAGQFGSPIYRYPHEPLAAEDPELLGFYDFMRVEDWSKSGR